MLEMTLVGDTEISRIGASLGWAELGTSVAAVGESDKKELGSVLDSSLMGTVGALDNASLGVSDLP